MVCHHRRLAGHGGQPPPPPPLFRPHVPHQDPTHHQTTQENVPPLAESEWTRTRVAYAKRANFSKYPPHRGAPCGSPAPPGSSRAGTATADRAAPPVGLNSSRMCGHGRPRPAVQACSPGLQAPIPAPSSTPPTAAPRRRLHSRPRALGPRSARFQRARRRLVLKASLELEDEPRVAQPHRLEHAACMQGSMRAGRS